MKEFKALIVSDRFTKELLSQKYAYAQFMVDYELKKWDELEGVLPRSYDVMIIDMAFEPPEGNREKIVYQDIRYAFLQSLLEMLEGDSPFKHCSMTIIVLCGSEDDFYSGDDGDKRYFNTYDFLRARLKKKDGNDLIHGGRGEGICPIATDLTLSYLDRFKDTGFFLYLKYDPESKECIGITPLARIREGDESGLTAFYYKEDRGLILVLPGYDLREVKRAQKIVIDISRNLLRKTDGVPYTLDRSIPSNVREDFKQAIICLDMGLYKASLVMARRTLEGCGKDVMEVKEGTKLENIIDTLHGSGKITDQTQEKMHAIRKFGNLGAHSYNLPDLSAEDVYNILELLQRCLEDIYCRDEEAGRTARERYKEIKESSTEAKP